MTLYVYLFSSLLNLLRMNSTISQSHYLSISLPDTVLVTDQPFEQGRSGTKTCKLAQEVVVLFSDHFFAAKNGLRMN